MKAAGCPLPMNDDHLVLDEALEQAQQHLPQVRSQTLVLGLSGGVDSAVAAWILRELGAQVIGIFMKNWEEEPDEYCSSRQDWLDAASVADVLGIELEAVNFAKEYQERVFASFLAEYRAGRTPNPDVLCNAEIKFRAFLDHALRHGAKRIATGHYARIARGSHAPGAGASTPTASACQGEAPFRLLKGVDVHKDQSYFLHRLNQTQLAHSVFPLGGLRKAAVRRIAMALGLPNALKKDSTGICFIGERPFRAFLQKFLPTRSGPVLDPTGRRVGEHLGLAFYTLGQRKGLGIGGVRGRDSEAAWYVARKDWSNNSLWAVQGHNHPWLMSTQLEAGQASWVLGKAPHIDAPEALAAKTRYRQSDAALHALFHTPEAKGFRLVFRQAQWAVTPGQSAVLYHGDECLGGGVIEAAVQD